MSELGSFSFLSGNGVFLHITCNNTNNTNNSVITNFLILSMRTRKLALYVIIIEILSK